MAAKTSILIASVVRQDPEVFRAHLECLKSQMVRDVEAGFLYLVDRDGEHAQECYDIAAEAGAYVLWTNQRDAGAEYAVSESTHHWTVPTFYFLAREKQRILDYALSEGYDGVFLVDSDLLCGSETLQSLLDTQKGIVSAVFWTSWGTGDDPLPQVWQQHPYGFNAAGWTPGSFLHALRRRTLVRVRGLGACTLIRREAIEKGAAFWPLVEGLPQGGMWQGEDRHFCVRAERLHIDLWADAWPEVWHCYRPSDRAQLAERKAYLTRFAEGAALPGDEVSISLETLDVPQLHAHREFVRGRLDGLPVLPGVKDVVSTLPIGASGFVTARFPSDWPVRPGEETTLRVTLLGAR